MMKIETGKGTISPITLIAVWSTSLVVNLPGLAITPILGNVEAVFPHTSELEVQMLTILPNLFIIPFVLLSGKLSVSKSKISILSFALVIYLLSGIAYFFAHSMTQLIVISCVLGIGCGLVIPIAAGLIADYFTGKYRMKQLGIKSGIANMALVAATFVVGWLAKENWRLPFIVYMTPLIPLLLTPFLWKKHHEETVARTDSGTPSTHPSRYRDSVDRATATASPISVIAASPAEYAAPPPPKGKIEWGKLGGAMALYGITTYAVTVVAYYLPFLASQYHIDDSQVGTITAVFFIAIMTPGFILPYIVKGLKNKTIPAALLSMFLGLLAGCAAGSQWMFGISAFLLGFGYGVVQPIVYDKAVECSSGQQSTLALSLVLAMNYTAVTIAPFVVDFFKWIFSAQGNLFPYILNSVITGVFLLLSVLLTRKFIFSVNEEYT